MYERYRTETTLLYRLIERYYRESTACLAEQGKYIPKYIEREFNDFLLSGRLLSKEIDRFKGSSCVE